MSASHAEAFFRTHTKWEQILSNTAMASWLVRGSKYNPGFTVVAETIRSAFEEELYPFVAEIIAVVGEAVVKKHVRSGL